MASGASPRSPQRVRGEPTHGQAGKTRGQSDKSQSADQSTAAKPESVTDLSMGSWKFILKKTLREFSKDRCTDLAAALTYYAVLALFPALLALVSLLALFNQGDQGTTALMGVVHDVAPNAAGTVQGVVSGLTHSSASGVGLIVGLLAALWSASGYVGAFGRALNRMYDIPEGRPFYKLRPTQLLVTLIAIVLAALVAFALAVSGNVARAVGNAIGIGNTGITIWNIAKWPVMLAIVILVVAVLYYVTPNIKQPHFRWISIGAAVAIGIWILASVGFGFYVANFGHYNKTYGSLAGVIVFLLWLWITNLALLFGAELDSEIERGRELQAGMAAERDIQLPPRDTKASDKQAAKDNGFVEQAEKIRDQADADSGQADRKRPAPRARRRR